MTINMTWLDGNKVYIVAGLIGLITAAKFLGWLTPDTALVLIGLLTGGGMAANRVATAKVMKAFNASKG